MVDRDRGRGGAAVVALVVAVAAVVADRGGRARAVRDGGVTMLEPGRELDTLVAEKVMGLNIPWDENTPCPKCGAEMRYCGNRSRCFDCYEWVYGPYKEYSTDIAAAWEVVEAADWFVGMVKCRKGGWSVTYRKIGLCALEVDAATAPHAICLAALKAKGVDIG